MTHQDDARTGTRSSLVEGRRQATSSKARYPGLHGLAGMTLNVRVPFDFRDSVLVDEPPLLRLDGFATGGAVDWLRFPEKHRRLQARV
jgi:hypothetical protein